MIIGVVGEAGSGKDAITDYLRDEKGFHIYSLSNTLSNVLEDLTLPPDNRELKIALGNSLRSTFGDIVLAIAARDFIDQHKSENIAIASIRNPSELIHMRDVYQAKIIGVNMPDKKRFELMQKRDRPGDPQTWDEFMALKEIESGIGQDKSGQQIKLCMDLAHVIIENDGELEDLYRKVDREVSGQRRGERI